jgi:D-alanyl-D-alanine carboxypeptidase/D-alanyl-D-alanine-endopeptidase (penicillin-binding protein 4)
MFRPLCQGALLAATLTLMPLASLVRAQASPPELPPLLAPSGLPQLLQQGRIACPALQKRLLAAVGSEASVWSISVVDANGSLLADLNGSRPRLPASNQKLISTAIAIDRLGPDHRFTTNLWQLPDGTLRLKGTGDPTLGFAGMRRIAKLASGSGGSTGSASGPLRLQIEEEPSSRWWPQGWSMADRDYDYGAPITRLALTANAVDMAIVNPPQRLERLLSQEISRNGRQALITQVAAGSPEPSGSVKIYSEPSQSMHHLMSMANGESHNFTSEVLLREGTGSWSLPIAQRRAMEWLQQQGLPIEGVSVADGSGLDRSNRVTSRLLTALLLRMAQHPYAQNYFGSMAVIGQRGTLSYYFRGSSLDGQFVGKTGTISGVKAVTGRLSTTDGPVYVSMISNGSYAPVPVIRRVLTAAQQLSPCPQPPL